MALLYGDQSAPDRFNKVGLTVEFMAPSCASRLHPCPPRALLWPVQRHEQRQALRPVIALNLLATR